MLFTDIVRKLKKTYNHIKYLFVFIKFIKYSTKILSISLLVLLASFVSTACNILLIAQIIHTIVKKAIIALEYSNAISQFL
jgi:hypothetical protein